MTHYTRVWLNISAQLRNFLVEGKLQNHLVWLQQVVGNAALSHLLIVNHEDSINDTSVSCQLSSELQRHPELVNGTDSELMQSIAEQNYTLPNTTALLQQLDTIDNAACGWTRFMSKVSQGATPSNRLCSTVIILSVCVCVCVVGQCGCLQGFSR